MMIKLFGVILGIVVLLWVLFGYFGIQALFTNRVVDEQVPRAVMEVVGENSVSSTIAMGEGSDARSASSIRILEGVFQPGDSTYSVQGKATITEDGGMRTLSLTDFRVTNGPDLFVYIVSAASADNLIVKDAVRANAFINVGALKGNQGNQTYVLPEDIRLDGSSIVSVWCRRFGRNFGVAPLHVPER